MLITKCRTYDDSLQFGESIGRHIVLMHSNKPDGVAGIDVNAVNKAVEKYYPEYSVKNVVVCKNTVFVNLSPKGDSGGFQLMEWHAIDPKSGKITGSIPVDDLFSDSAFLNALKNSIRINDHLEHHGILGQKWGVRRFQNPDGTLTAEGKERYGVDSGGNDALKKEYYRQVRTLKRKLDRSNLSLQQRNVDRYNEKAVRDATSAARRVFQGNALGAAFDVGYAAYDVLRSQLASYRMSEIGHQKMVQQGNAQIKKMLNTFKDTPYEKLVKKYGRVK